MANENWVKTKNGLKGTLGLLALGTVIIGGYALLVRIFALRGK